MHGDLWTGLFVGLIFVWAPTTGWYRWRLRKLQMDYRLTHAAFLSCKEDYDKALKEYKDLVDTMRHDLNVANLTNESLVKQLDEAERIAETINTSAIVADNARVKEIAELKAKINELTEYNHSLEQMAESLGESKNDILGTLDEYRSEITSLKDKLGQVSSRLLDVKETVGHIDEDVVFIHNLTKED